MGEEADNPYGRLRAGCRALLGGMDAGEEIRIVGALLTALAVTMLATPLARRIAVRRAFFDHPVGYKEHSQPTPYLGGAAVMAGVMAGTVIGGAAADYKRLLVAAMVLFAIGTLDDRLRLGVTLRVIAQVATAVALWVVD